MRKTPAGFGIREISNDLNPPELRNPTRRKSAQSVDDITKIEDAQDVMRYGGKGVGRKLLFGATSTVVGERVAKRVARKYGNKQQQEEAFETLYGKRKRKSGTRQSTTQQTEESQSVSATQDVTQSSSSQRQQQRSFDSLNKSIESTVERVVKGEVGKVLEELKNNSDSISQVKEIVERIEKRVSPRDVNVGSGKQSQTFRFDPLAPEGRQVTLVNEGGKSERLASKEGGGQSEYQKVISKAAYFGAKDLQERRTNVEELQEELNPEKRAKFDKIKKVKDKEAKDLAKYLKKELSQQIVKVIKQAIGGGGGGAGDDKKVPGGPENFDEYSKMLDNIDEAQNTLRYGGTGVGRKLLFGATKTLVGERLAKRVARKYGNKEQQERALNIMKNPMYGIRGEEETSNTTPTIQQTQQPTANTSLTSTQQSAQQEIEVARKQETTEEDKEFKENIIKKLDEILEAVGGKSGGGGGGISGGLMAAAAAALSNPALRAALLRGGKFALKRIPLVGAALTGYEAGEALNEATGASQGISDALSDDKSKEEVAAEDKNLSNQALDRVNSKLKGTGYTALGAGRYQGPDNKIYDKSSLPQDLQQKLGGVVAAPTVTPEAAKETATPPEPRPKEEAPVQSLSNENEELKREQNQQPPVVVAPQQTNLQMAAPQEQKSEPTIIQTRNFEPSVATYVASIFDHPVVHPGIYKM